MPLFLFAILFVVLLSFAYAAVSGAPWVPTKKKDIARALKLLDLKKGEKFYELGAGDARLLCRAIKETGCDGVGVELSLLQWLVGWLRLRISKCPGRMKLADARKIDLSDADAVYMFLMPKTYNIMKSKLEEDLKPGARVVTYVWPIDGWKASKVDEQEKAPPLYLYQK